MGECSILNTTSARLRLSRQLSKVAGPGIPKDAEAKFARETALGLVCSRIDAGA
jgi:hypothetical protein